MPLPLLIATLTLLLQNPPAPGGAGEASADAQLFAKVDELWKRRDDRAAFGEQKALLEQALARSPNDYGVLWRAARWYFWRSDDPELSTEERTKLGKHGWDLAEKAITRNPDHVAGHFWAAANMGNYALGLGIVRALAQRIEGKFRERLGRAEALDPSYAHGSIQVAWARYYAKLPWPKYDQKKARAYYKQAFERNPHNLRARLFLAELLHEEDEPDEARRLVAEVLKATPGKYDAPEERRSKMLAGRFASKLDQR